MEQTKRELRNVLNDMLKCIEDYKRDDVEELKYWVRYHVPELLGLLKATEEKGTK